MGQNASLNVVLNEVEKQVAALTYDGSSRYYLPTENLPDGAMLQGSYDVSPTGTPSLTVNKAAALRNMSTEEELSAQFVGDHLYGRTMTRLPVDGTDTLTIGNGTGSLYTKNVGGDMELWVKFRIDSVDYDARITTSATPTPTATPTP